MSERYDLLEASHRDFLAILAGEASQLFGLKQVLDVSSGLLGMRHDCATLLNQIIDLVDTQPTAWQEETVSIIRFLLETVDTYCRPATRNPATFAAYECIETKVREEVALAADAVKHEMGRVSGMDCRIAGDLVAVVQPSYLMNIVYNLLKNAWAATPVNGPPILVTADIVEGYLEVSIMDMGPGMSAEALEEYNSPDALRMLMFGLPHRRVKGLGLLVAQRIAGWHALPDGRTGEVRLCPGGGGSGIRAVVRLPIAEGVNGNELKGPKET
jgi:signal transduction histidine kinase